MPVSYLEIDGIRYEVPATGKAIRFLDDDGSEVGVIHIDTPGLFAIGVTGGLQVTGNLAATGAAAITGAVTAGTLSVTGNVTLSGGTVFMDNLPTADPEEAGQLWSNSGVLTVSAGA